MASFVKRCCCIDEQDEFFEAILLKCTSPDCEFCFAQEMHNEIIHSCNEKLWVFLGCCGFCAPRYKRLVDSVFPADPKVNLLGQSNKNTFEFTNVHMEYICNLLSRMASSSPTWRN